MTELYNRQASLNLYTPTSVAVVGVGGIGSWVAILSAMSGVKNLYLFDPDKIEESNLNRLPFCEGSIGRYKVDVVADYISTIRPECNVAPIPDKLSDIILQVILLNVSVIVECTDSPLNQIKLYKACTGNSPMFIRAGYDGTRITVTSKVTGWMTADEEATYTINPSWVVPAVTVAAMAVAKIMKYKDQEVSLDISEIGIPILKKHSRVMSRCAIKS